MTQTIPLNPNVLKWARETAGLSVDEVAYKLKRKNIHAETVSAWERGECSPSYPQLETLAYQIYKRPLALFFFPAPPEEETPRQSFRTLPEQEINLLPSRIRFFIRKAKVMQMNLGELFDNINPASQQIVSDLSFKPDVSADKMATHVRDYLGTGIKEQNQWKDVDEALKNWRIALETKGVFVFKDAFKNDAFSGFCLYDEIFPVIYVNNSKPKSRQIFTLFHELAHLLFRTGGIDMRLNKYLHYLEGDSRRIEILCNRFAGEFLVPGSDFSMRIKNMKIGDEAIQNLADFYHVSREVILRKLSDRGLVDNSYYENKAREWEKTGRKGSGQGGDYYLTKGVYLGERYLDQAFRQYYHQRISREQLAEYLEVKRNHIHGMESLLYPKRKSV